LPALADRLGPTIGSDAIVAAAPPAVPGRQRPQRRAFPVDRKSDLESEIPEPAASSRILGAPPGGNVPLVVFLSGISPNFSAKCLATADRRPFPMLLRASVSPMGNPTTALDSSRLSQEALKDFRIQRTGVSRGAPCSPDIARARFYALVPPRRPIQGLICCCRSPLIAGNPQLIRGHRNPKKFFPTISPCAPRFARAGGLPCLGPGHPGSFSSGPGRKRAAQVFLQARKGRVARRGSGRGNRFIWGQI